jgi:cytochrome c biogenesis protein CcmG/thiol:disulfide interchange protein DsbE
MTDRRNPWLLLPLLVFVAFVFAVGSRLSDPPDPTVKSRMVGKPVPTFALPAVLPNKPGLTSTQLAGGQGPRLVNVFASWCVPCIAEMPMLQQLQREGMNIDAIAIRDKADDIAAFLAEHGDPFERIGNDPRSQAQMALGSAGVPESFLIDSKGIIRLQHVGPITADDLPTIRAAWKAAE